MITREHLLYIGVTIALASILFVSLYQGFSSNDPTAAVGRKAKTVEQSVSTPDGSRPANNPLAGKSNCGEFVERCIARGEVNIDGCDDALAREKLAELLRAPLQGPACAKVVKEMEANCAQGCELDYGSMVVIPGELNVAYTSTVDEFGRCQVRGSRQVSLAAHCRAIR